MLVRDAGLLFDDPGLIDPTGWEPQLNVRGGGVPLTLAPKEGLVGVSRGLYELREKVGENLPPPGDVIVIPAACVSSPALALASIREASSGSGESFGASRGAFVRALVLIAN